MNAPRTVTVDFPFVEGQREDADRKILPDGYVTRVRNMRLRKESAWGVRYDYESLGDETVSGNLTAADLVSFDGRLMAYGVSTITDSTVSDLYEYVDEPQFEWRGTYQDVASIRTVLVQSVRDMGRVTSQGYSVDKFDVAVANGIGCLVFELTAGVGIHVFDVATDATIHSELLATRTRPRVVAVGDTFFITCQELGTSVELYKYDQSSDTAAVQLTDAFAVGGAITANDMTRTLDGLGFAACISRSGSSQIKIFNGSGTATNTITGPAVTLIRMAVMASHLGLAWLAAVEADFKVDVYSYVIATGALNTSALSVSSETERQPGLALAPASNRVFVTFELRGTEHTRVFDVNEVTGVIILTYDIEYTEMATKPYRVPGKMMLGSTNDEGDCFRSNQIVSVDIPGGTNREQVAAFMDQFAAGRTHDEHLPQTTVDIATGRMYLPKALLDGNSNVIPSVSELVLDASQRRQTTTIGGMLYTAGGLVSTYDGRTIFEAGFAERPRIISATPSNGAGSLPSSVPLLVCTTWEWFDAKGNFHTSRPSVVETVTMGASDDTITVVATLPHTFRQSRSSSDIVSGSVTLVVWRSISGINQLRFAASAQADSYGGDLTVVLLDDDAAVRAQRVIYTQGGRGVLSAVEPHESPVPAEYIWRFGNRLLTAGGPNRYQAQVSKELFPGEPVQWSNATGFFVRGPDSAINGVASVGGRGILCTREKLFEFSGEGPNDNGEGSYSDATEIAGSVGLNDWRSLVSTPVGLMFQGADGLLWVLPITGDPPVQFRQVEDTMAAFPVVTSASLSQDEQLVSFTCLNEAGTDSVIVSFDLHAKTWIVDDFSTPTPIAAAVSYQGRLVYLSGGEASREREEFPAASFIPHGIVTGDIKPAGQAGWIELVGEHFLGEIRGDVNLRARVSYDSGTTFTTLKTHQLRLVDTPYGTIIRRSWHPLVRKCERYQMEFMALDAGSPTEGLVFNAHSAEIVPARGAARLPASKRG